MQEKGSIVLQMFGILAMVMFVASGCGSSSSSQSKQQTQQIGDLTPVQAGNEVIAEGKVKPLQSADLKFERSGTVAEILVEEGSTVKKGTPLIRLDTRDLTLSVEQAQASLAQAQADYAKLMEGATPEEKIVAKASVKSSEAQLRSVETGMRSSEAGVSGAQAQVARAQAQLQQVQGQVTDNDIAAAQARVEQARLELARKEAGPKTTEVQQSQAKLQQAITALQEQRDMLSAAKTNAYNQMVVAANTLRDRQTSYSNIYWQNRNTERNFSSVNLDLPQKNKDNEESNLRMVKNAEAELEQARINYEKARQAEITGVKNAEEKVKEAQAAYNELMNGFDPDDVATSRYNYEKAKADLEQLQGKKRAGDLAAAQASVADALAGLEQAKSSVEQTAANIEKSRADVEQAQANLDKTLADARKSDQDKSLAIIKEREVALKEAQLSLDKATIYAPFDGNVVEVVPKKGEWFGTSEVAVTMADFSQWKIDTVDLEELGIVKVHIGSIARVTFDAVPGLEIPGKVTAIQNIGKNYQGDTVYQVTVKPDQWDERLRWNMKATVSIEPADQQPPKEATPEPQKTP